MAIINVGGYSDSLSPVGVSALGTVVFDNVVFPAGTWVDLNSDEKTFDEVKLDSVALSVNRAKRIVSSRVSGRVGMIKEYITSDDYSIRLEAIIAPEAFDTVEIAQALSFGSILPLQFAAGAAGVTVPREPMDMLRRVKLLDDVQDSLTIYSKLLNNVFDINEVIIEECSITKFTADSYALSMSLVSDEKVSLKGFG